MAILRRRERKGAPLNLEGTGLDQADLDAVAETVADAAEAALGTRPAVAEGPAPVFAGCGPGAWWVRLDTEDPAWSGGLVARDLDDATLAREAAWIRAVSAAGFPAPSLVVDPPGEVLIHRLPPGINLTAQMLKDMAGIGKLIGGLGDYHARLHRTPARPEGVTGADEDPLAELERRAGTGAGRAAIADELGWLQRNRPEPAGTVVCHSELNPIHVYLDGGDFSSAIALNWSRARLAEPAYDVAATVVALWTVPVFLDNAMYRKAMKMARDPLVTNYLEAYNASADRPVDEAALRYWQVHHLTAMLADTARKEHDELGTPWDAARGIADPKSATKDLRERIRSLAAG